MLVEVMRPAKERKALGRPLDENQAIENMGLLVLLLRQLFRGCIPTFLENPVSIKKFRELIQVRLACMLRTQYS